MGFIKSAKMVLKYAFRSSGAMTLTIIFMMLGTIASVTIPRITEFIINGIEFGTLSTIELLINLGLIIGIAIISAFLSGMSRYHSSRVSTNAIYYLRKNVYGSINRQSFSFFDKTETGQLISRSTSDIDLLSPLFGMGITFTIQGTITISLVLIMVTIMAPTLSWIMWVAIFLYIIMIFLYSFKLKEPFLKSRQSFGDLTTIIRENILGSQVVRIFNSADKEKLKFEKENTKFLNLTIKSIKFMTILQQFSRFFVGLISLLFFFFGGTMVYNGQMHIGRFIAFGLYMTMIASPLWMLVSILIQFVQADASLTRVRDVLDTIPEIKEIKNPISANEVKGNIEFKNVNFGYTSTLVLKNLNFKISKGEKIALLGTTGSGKSTLISLLPRFYDVIQGELLIDDIDIKQYNIKELREQIGYVSQNIFLFNSSIKENIAFGNEDASIEKIKMAAENANISDFIETLPEKYDTLVGERGTQLSGGQKQRIAIARALIIQPKMLILDDSTSSVDVDTEYKIQSALNSLMIDRTTLIITQRISTIRNADKIIVMDKGRIVGIGKHGDLYETNPLYKQIYETLFRKQKQLDSNNSPQIKEDNNHE